MPAFLAFLSAVGKTVAIAFDHVEDGLARGAYGWSLEVSRGGGELLMVMMAFGAVLTQYAIALELRLAYCGLQDTNLDLQVNTYLEHMSGQSHAKVLIETPRIWRLCGTFLRSRSLLTNDYTIACQDRRTA